MSIKMDCDTLDWSSVSLQLPSTEYYNISLNTVSSLKKEILLKINLTYWLTKYLSQSPVHFFKTVKVAELLLYSSGSRT